MIGGGPMPAYIRMPHDELLAAVLDPVPLDAPAGHIRYLSVPAK